jgi:hypothetical protein
MSAFTFLGDRRSVFLFPVSAIDFTGSGFLELAV